MSISGTDDPLNEPGPSKPSAQLPICTQCNSQPSKYTCPRCQTKTCSLLCSRAHKASTDCTGERDRTAFVPMNQYGYGALVNDYVFLEEVGRNVENWGREIMKDGLLVHAQRGGTGRGRSMRGGRGRGGAFGQRKDTRSFLAMQLGLRDIDMDVLAPGMKRAKQNKSHWDGKGKRAIFTVEFLFKLPGEYTTGDARDMSIISHKNDWDRSIRQILQTNVNRENQSEAYDDVVRWLRLEYKDVIIPSNVLCLMKRPRSSDDSLNLNPSRPSYYRLDWNTKLSRILRHKQFVEFPTIILIDRSQFDGVLVDDSGIAEDMREQRPKRRKLDLTEAKKTISGLVGEYGSDDETEESNVLEALANYSESEASEEDVSGLDGDELPDEMDDEQTDDIPNIIHPGHMPDDIEVAEEEDGEDLDWGDDEIADDEAKLADLSAVLQARHSSH